MCPCFNHYYQITWNNGVRIRARRKASCSWDQQPFWEHERSRENCGPVSNTLLWNTHSNSRGAHDRSCALDCPNTSYIAGPIYWGKTSLYSSGTCPTHHPQPLPGYTRDIPHRRRCNSRKYICGEGNEGRFSVTQLPHTIPCRTGSGNPWWVCWYWDHCLAGKSHGVLRSFQPTLASNCAT